MKAMQVWNVHTEDVTRTRAHVWDGFVQDTYCTRYRWSSCHGTGCPWPDTPDWLHKQPCCTSHNFLQESKKTDRVTLSISFYIARHQRKLKISKKNLVKEWERESSAAEEWEHCRGQLCCDTKHNNVCSDWHRPDLTAHSVTSASVHGRLDLHGSTSILRPGRVRAPRTQVRSDISSLGSRVIWNKCAQNVPKFF